MIFIYFASFFNVFLYIVSLFTNFIKYMDTYLKIVIYILNYEVRFFWLNKKVRIFRVLLDATYSTRLKEL